MSVGGLFAEWQPRYAERGIATFPVRDKVPAVARFDRMGLPASRKLLPRFANENEFGFLCGKHNGITVLDVDAPDERLLADALNEFGPTPLIVRSGSGNFQGWYRHNGEGRKIRPDKSRPIDILGGGYVVAPPSRSSRGEYEIISGSLDDLAALPTLAEAPLRLRKAVSEIALAAGAKIERGQRNKTLWCACMEEAPNCPTEDRLMAFAAATNVALFVEPLAADEVCDIAGKVWRKEQSGQNWYGRGGVPVPRGMIDDLMMNDPDAFVLLMFLWKEHRGLRSTFICANEMAAIMPEGGWSRKRFASARRKLEETGEIEIMRAASCHSGPARYRFKGGRK